MSGTLWDRPIRTAEVDWDPDALADVVVVGAGLTGLCTALLLARAGMTVVVLEATGIGALASGRNTGKVTVLQGTRVSQLLATHPVAVAQAYVEGNREGAAWLRVFCERHGVDFQVRDAITYAGTDDAVPAVEEEWRALRRLDVGAQWRDSLDVPFDVRGAVVLGEQMQLDPMALLQKLVDEVESHGGVIVCGDRVVGASWALPPEVHTASGERYAGRELVLATGTPILDRGLYFAKLAAHRSSLLAFTGAASPPGMMISANGHTRSLRDVPGDESSPGHLLVGGAGHWLASGPPETERLEELREWVDTAYPGAVETHAWSAQDYRSHDGIPYVGHLPRGRGSIWLATGYDKWGLANAAAASLRIAGKILGSGPAWARPMERRITAPSDAVNLLVSNLGTVKVAAERLIRAETTTVSPEGPRVVGQVGRSGIDPRPIGVASADCAVRAICTHLGGTLRWNDAEHTWDCPLHGSRFAADGAVIEGPAVAPLARVEP